MKTICVFGSSSEQIDRLYLESAEHLGAMLEKKGYGLIFGAGKFGVMGAVSRGMIAAGGKPVGVSPQFFVDLDVLRDDCEIVFTESMRERKAYMEDNSDAFIICPGGIGTFEEFFEVLTLKQLGRHAKAIVIYNVNGFYTPLLDLMQTAINDRFLAQDTSTLFTVAETEENVLGCVNIPLPDTPLASVSLTLRATWGGDPAAALFAFDVR